MRMTRLISMALVAVLAFAVAAVAHNSGGQAEPTKEVTATFTATPVADKTKTRQCTGADGTYAITKSVAKGTADGDDDRLDGNITIKSKSVVNTTTGLGWSDGKVFTTDPATGKLKGVSGFTAVIKGDKLEGFVQGKVKNAAAPTGETKAKSKGRHKHGKRGATLRANFAATVAQDGALTGQLGGGGGDNTAIISGNPCQKQQNQPSSQNDDGRRGHDHRSADDDKRGNGHRGGDDR
jgi:hypothetical protein